MSILLSDISALEFWRYAAHAHCLPPASAHCILDAPLGATSVAEIAEAVERGFSFLSEPVHVLVEDKASRCRSKAVRSHVAPNAILARNVVRLSGNVFVVTPAACLYEMTSSLPFPNAVEVGFELCGRYACAVGKFEGLAKRAPLVSVAEFDRFMRRLEGVRGTGTARRIAKLVRDGARSPMEAVTVALLCFPVRLGGYGLPFPVVNAVIKVPSKDRPVVGKCFYECDLYWPEARFAIEYDSNLHHTGPVRIAEDASRRADLAYLGIEVAALTQRQAYNPREMDRIARLLAKRLGKRLRVERLDPHGAQSRLRAALLEG